MTKAMQTLANSRSNRDADVAAKFNQTNAQLDSAFLPLRHAAKTSNELQGDQWRQLLVKLSKVSGTGFLVAIVGPRGTGKTQLGVEIIRKFAARFPDRTSRYATAMDIFVDLKDTYRSQGTREKDVRYRYASYGMLVIDEIHNRSDNNWEQMMLNDILDIRYRQMLDTLLLGNIKADQLQDYLGPTIADRMRETGAVEKAVWKSWRQR